MNKIIEKINEGALITEVCALIDECEVLVVYKLSDTPEFENIIKSMIDHLDDYKNYEHTKIDTTSKIACLIEKFSKIEFVLIINLTKKIICDRL
jgi:hypothetical protein